MTHLETIPQSGAELSRTELITLAADLHQEIAAVTTEVAEVWYRMSSLLEPFERLALWKYVDYEEGDELVAYSSFKDYVEREIKQNVSTIKNYLNTRRAIVKGGADPEQLKDVPMSRVNELAKICKSRGGLPPAEVWEPLVEAARSAVTRPEVAEFREKLDVALKAVGDELDTWFRILCTPTQKEFFENCLDVQMGHPEYKTPPSRAEAFEHILAEWFQLRDGVKAKKRPAKKVEIMEEAEDERF